MRKTDFEHISPVSYQTHNLETKVRLDAYLGREILV